MSFDVRCQMFNDNGYTIDKKGDIMICQSAQCPRVFVFLARIRKTIDKTTPQLFTR